MGKPEMAETRRNAEALSMDVYSLFECEGLFSGLQQTEALQLLFSLPPTESTEFFSFLPIY